MELVLNFFVFVDAGMIRQYGVSDHWVDGTDNDKLDHLLAHVTTDHAVAKRFDFSRPFTRNEWLAALRFGDIPRYFEDALMFFRAGDHITYCVTPVIDGVIDADKQTVRDDLVTRLRAGESDYLNIYVRDNTFHLVELIDDDYFKAIKLLFNSGLHVSSAKLLMSCIDTLAFVEHGDEHGNFVRWLETYVDLEAVGVSAREVWEFRNSLLHMTNLESRQVLAGKVAPIVPLLGRPPTTPRTNLRPHKLFDLHLMMQEVVEGATRWATTYADPEKMLKFIERYDTTIADGRASRVIALDEPK